MSSAAAIEALPAPRIKPLLRGWSHVGAFFGALAAGGWLLSRWPTEPALLYASSLLALFGVSALYHRPTWSPVARNWMKRLDHSVIFFLVAGTFTPLSTVLAPSSAHAMLWMAWTGAAAGVGLSIAWPRAPKPILAAVYMLLGWMVVWFLPEVVRKLGPSIAVWVLVGGVLYSLGALTYARRRPDPWPRVFGYHEIFHAFVIVGSACHFAAVVECLRAG